MGKDQSLPPLVLGFVWLLSLGIASACGCGDDDRSRNDASTDLATDADWSGDPASDSALDVDALDGLADPGDVDTDGAPANQLTGTLRDFSDTHPDFEDELGVDPGIVLPDLGTDGKPVYAGETDNPTTHGQEPFDQWFRDTPGVNQSMPFTITLSPAGGGVYSYDNPEFFPLDGLLLGNEGRDHNYHFTYEIHTRFQYEGGEVFTFTGDDDLFVFVNGRLAIDLGGVHGPMSSTIDFDAMAGELGISPGNAYDLDFFFAERHTTQSNFRIDTTIEDFDII